MSKLKFKQNICVITGSRADYGILSYFLKELNKDFNLKIIVTGSHLSKKFGYTFKDIKKDKLKIYKKINILKNDDSEQGITKAISSSITKFSNIFKKMKIDLLIVLGDRYEVFGACVAASVMRIRIAHIHGGETTSNSLDEIFRHSITLMSCLHFVAAKKYKQKVMQLSKDKKNIYLVGSLSVANIKRFSIKINNNAKILTKYKLNKKKKRIFFQYHPETLEKKYGKKGLVNCLAILRKFSNYEIIATMANADSHHKFFNKILNDYKRSNKNFNLFKSIKYLDYLILLKSCEFIIGNSSSGIIEAPTFSVPTVNVGLRQDGRLRSSSVFDTSENKSSIYRAIKLALNFNKNKKIVRNPYDYGDTVSKILTILKNRQTYKNIKQFSFQNFKF